MGSFAPWRERPDSPEKTVGIQTIATAAGDRITPPKAMIPQQRLVLMREGARIARTDPGSNLARSIWKSYDMHLSLMLGVGVEV